VALVGRAARGGFIYECLVFIYEWHQGRTRTDQESMASGQNQDRPGQTRTDQDSMASGQLIMVIFLC